jgi:hypothetical protein
MKVKHLLTFYGDTQKVKNHKFCFKINSYNDVNKSLQRFANKGIYVRAAWYVKVTGGIASTGVRVK